MKKEEYHKLGISIPFNRRLSRSELDPYQETPPPEKIDWDKAMKKCKR